MGLYRPEGLLPSAIILLLAASCSALGSRPRSLGGYVGSASCVACHQELHPDLVAAWRAGRHRATMQKAGRGDALPQAGIAYVIGPRDGRNVLLSADSGIIPSGGWQDDELFPPHDVIATQPGQVDAGRQCLGCHVTGHFASRGQFAEPGIGCEACHGPGKGHVASRGAKANILNPAHLAVPRANMVCGQCHSLGRDHSGAYPFPVMREGDAVTPFRPGQDLATAFVDAKPKVARKGWEHSLFIRAAARYSAQRCTECHDPHGRPGNPAMLKDPTSEMCLRCHGIGRARLRYQNHAGLGDAIRKPCWTCHHNAHSH